MEVNGNQNISKVAKVASLKSWDLFVTQATNQGCPIVVHFTASWCMPSVAMNPVFEELAASYPDALFLTVDVDEVKEVATKMDVKAMPTFLLIKDSAPVDKLVGANPEEIRKRIDGFVQFIPLSIA
ncbi:Thioredoxin [Quillaja saponaria]|uniref:Thioredoxin n=1 Tax=Quillaja saponaria TaxID=32244 RepID=A0AAD7KW20_QUISA|nr:Thioredoxin [Quillaja saponaria]